jgi:Uma2 family endonuclease
MVNQIRFSPLQHRYTLEEFWALPEREDREYYDLIGGILFMNAAPDVPHGDVASRMNRILCQFLIETNLEGAVFHPHTAIWRDADESTYLEPDMMYVSKELHDRMDDKRTSADIVFEYLSRSTSIYDRTSKADTYLALGVRELWLIDPVTVTIEVRHAHHEADTLRWETFIYSQDEQAKSRVLDGWEVSVTELFDGLV